MKTQLNRLSLALVNAAMISVAGCGGGSSSDGSTPSPIAPLTVAVPTAILTGAVMVDQAVRNAVVCMDLNANNVCDANEPASARTGDDGAYSLTYDTAAVTAAQVAAASLIAPMVPGSPAGADTTIDAADPYASLTAKPYVLKQVPGQSGQINPLTTLMAAGVSAGMTEAVARSNVAAQLAIAEAKIDNYQNDPAFNNAQVQDNARVMAKATGDALEHGAVLQVGDPTGEVEAAAGDLASLNFTDPSNHFFRTLDFLAKPAGTAGVLIVDARNGKTGGGTTANGVLYNQAYLTSSGWVRCDDTVPITATRGNPNRSTFCNASNSVGYTVPSGIAGQVMTEVVNNLQADTATNVINNGVAATGLLAALGSATFPSGSVIRARSSLNLTQPIYINSINTDGRPQLEATTLEQLIAAKPSSGVNLATAAGSLTLGLSSGNLKNLRVAFTGTTSPTAGTVQFYDCDLNSAQTVASNCVTAQTGTFSISTIGGMRVMRFAGHAETIMNQTNLYAEVKDAPGVISGNWVFRARETKPSLDVSVSTAKRLNPTAWAAMKSQLGL
ncbi:MAG: hypothetical protein Q7T10_13910 [Rhodoferax sp.]|uniref:hypothetical protein n=1 Tax=Rhodoferax sp. TaxID=50421 RepID=UPI0027253FC7|nr:hypothetical protein [Rhodoferax sp.]MDO8449888.1 hypothetical protein [Rhodoferax sp.]